MERPVASRDIEDAVRRVERQRAMLAELGAMQSQALRELRELVVKAGGAPPEGTSLPDFEAGLRQAGPAPAEIGPAGRKVLIIDDDPTTRNLIAHFLRKEDLIVIKASGGNDGLARAGSERPDLLIVDAAVPGPNGLELLNRLKRYPETSGLPVLILSSLDDEEAIVQCLDAGADYIVKPFSPRVLVANVKKILRDASGHAADRRPL